MTEYRVRIYKDGIWDGEMPIPCEAESPLAAARLHCGEDLLEDGELSKLRAEVWERGSVRKRISFYASAVAQAPTFINARRPEYSRRASDRPMGGSPPPANDEPHDRHAASSYDASGD
jgi:hypothetical protein